jgi:NAD(P)-dependent dehydrogenase (short-subunit alcohol dehydrogenase family)
MVTNGGPNPSTPGVLAGHVALVTGASRGIGRATAQALAAAGAAVAVTARTAEDLAQTVDLIEAQGGRAVALPADVTDQEAIEGVVTAAERQLGPVDLLVNNAGIARALGPVWEVDPDAWWRDVEVDLRGPFLCARAVLPSMLARHRGRIVNVSSGVGLVPAAGLSAYACAKAALFRLTDTLAAETAERGVAVFVISPGLVRTAGALFVADSPIGQHWLPQLHAGFEQGKDVPPERAADLVVALAAGRADALSGLYLSIGDDLEALVQRAEELRRDKLYTLRLRR